MISLFVSKKTKEALKILDTVSCEFNPDAFPLVKHHIRKSFLKNKKLVSDALKEGRAIREYIYTCIAIVSKDLLASGEYHLYRGIINPMGSGNQLLEIFNKSVDEAIKNGNRHLTAQQWKDLVNEDIKQAG
jgi:hypothetical protein